MNDHSRSSSLRVQGLATSARTFFEPQTERPWTATYEIRLGRESFTVRVEDGIKSGDLTLGGDTGASFARRSPVLAGLSAGARRPTEAVSVATASQMSRQLVRCVDMGRQSRSGPGAGIRATRSQQR